VLQKKDTHFYMDVGCNRGSGMCVPISVIIAHTHRNQTLSNTNWHWRYIPGGLFPLRTMEVESRFCSSYVNKTTLLSYLMSYMT